MKKKTVLLVALILNLLISNLILSQDWNLVQQLGTMDQLPADNLGISTAISDSFMIAGAWWSEGNNGPSSSGAAYIYKLQEDNSWKEYQKLVSPNPESLGYYGYEVAIDGHYIFVGAYNEDHSGHGNAGRVYAYYLDEDKEWIWSDSISIENPENADYLGYAIDMTEDYAVIGAYRHPFDENQDIELSTSGAAYIVQRNSNNKWEIIKKLTPEDRAVDDQFGKFLAIDKKGLAVGAFNKDYSFSIFRSGAVYAVACEDDCEFENINSSDLIKIDNPEPGSFENFGIGVAVSGKWLAIGKPGESDQPDGGISGNTGAVYFYKWVNSEWIYKQKVYASDFAGQAFFGETISMDGGICAIGASGEAKDESGQNPLIRAGSVYVFEINENEEWIQVQKLVGIGRTFDDLLADEGLSVDGNKISAGAWLADTINGEFLIDGGAVYIFERNGDLPNSSFNLIKNTGIKIANNPSSERLHLINEDSTPFKGQLEIFTIDGQKIFTKPISIHNNLSLNVSRLPSNMYWVKISSRNKISFLKWVKI